MGPPRHDLDGLKRPLPEWFKAAFEVPRTSGQVEVQGCAIHYLEWGDRSQPPILLTHGFLAHAHVFAFIAPMLAHRFHLVAFDLSGMGSSGHRSSTNASYGSRVQEAIAVAEATDLFRHRRRPLFVTHSFGGTVAIEVFERHPERFGGLVVCDLMMMPPDHLAEHFKRDPIARMPPERAAGHRVYADLETILGRYRLAPPQPCANDFLMEYMARHSVRRVDGGWSWKFDPKILLNDRHPVDWWSRLPHRLAALKTRKAIVHGRDSDLFGPPSVDFVQDLVGPHVPIIGLVGAHHHLMLDQPLAFVAALEALLTSWSVSDDEASR